MDIPLIPDFNNYKDRNKWIFDHAQYFTIVRRGYKTEERHTYDDAVKLAQWTVKLNPDARLLIYAVAAGHGTLAATVSSKGVKVCE
jgi:hypothetical protein